MPRDRDGRNCGEIIQKLGIREGTVWGMAWYMLRLEWSGLHRFYTPKARR
ncbi:MAG: hypothetical protein WBL68_00705 [Nitrososphaeraceae archaeon]